MKKIFLSIIIIIINLYSSFAQGTVRGKISDKTGETLIGVTVVLKSNPSVGAVTDLDGNYTLKIKDSTQQTIVASFISYQPVEEKINPKNGEVIVKDFVLESSSKELGAVEIVAKVTKAKEYYMENVKKNSSTTIDYISAETMKKTGDANVVAAVARVSGVSTNGGFITVRGIGDRYVKTTINGSRIPTLDPFTNNIKLDLFPASLVDNIIITKTASPDLPGDWAGAYLSVETKDYPEKLSVNVETTVGYNNQSTFKDVLSSDRSKTDWLGYDNSFREHNHDNFVSYKSSPSDYETFVALGLGNYYKANGITEWKESGIAGTTYFNLSLVQLGLLAPALINDANAVATATSQFNNGNYRTQAFNSINAEVPANSKSFANNWNTTVRKAPLNFSQSFSIGNQSTFLGKPIGYILGFRYSSATEYDPTSVRHVATVDTFSTLKQQISRETNGWSALMNVSYKLNDNNSLSFLFMPNFNGVNNVRKYSDDSEVPHIINGNAQFYEQRKQLVYQLKSENYIPRFKTKIEFNASYTNGKSSAPDFKNLQYWNDNGQYLIGNGIGDGVNRYYRYLSDKVFDSRLSAELPIGNKPELPRKIKFGAAYQTNNKKSDQYNYLMMIDSKLIAANPLTSDDIDGYFANKFDIYNGIDINGQPYSSIFCSYVQNSSPVDHTFGKSKVSAAFAMADYTVIPALRISGGVRIEKANMFTDVYEYDALGYAANDQRRVYNTSVPLANPGKFNEINYLPSANIIYKLRMNEDSPINVRFNFSQTVARPSIRELSDVANYDYELRAPVFGNSDLKTVKIMNYDIRLETYFKNGDNLSVSGFYKNFKNHIELVNTGGYTWENVDKSKVTGIELEGKKKITKHFEFRANITLVKSRTQYVRKTTTISDGVKTYLISGEGTRAMFGQAPYIVNSILAYNSDSLGLGVALSYNIQGPRLVIASQVEGLPDIYEMPRHLLDCKITKKLGKHFSASFTVRDILNTYTRRSYKYSDGYTLDYDKYRYGTNYLLGIGYKI